MNTKSLGHYVRVYDDVLEPDTCKKMIDIFNEKQNEFNSRRESKYSWEKDYRSFVEVNITVEEPFKEFVEDYYVRMKNVYEHYKQVTGVEFFPPKFAFEDARLKRYFNNDYDQFGWHVDVGDRPSASRYLVMFTYLNDVEEGGETEFEIDCLVKPKCGRMVVFPPMWMYPHKGRKPISNDKYILSTYLHYT
jgi:hypothetical protein